MRTILLLAGKDLRIELRSKQRVSVLLLLSFVLAFAGSFAYRWQADSVSHVLPLFWIVSVFTQLFFLSDAYRPELENRCFDALRIAPVHAHQILFGKLLASLALVLPVNLAILLEVSFFNNSAYLLRVDLLVLLLLESVGLLLLGNLFFARMAAGESSGFELYPVVITLAVPLIFLAMDASHLVATGPGESQLVYFGILLFYDLFLAVACGWAYRSMIED